MKTVPPIQRNKKLNFLQQELEEKINIINTQENTIRDLYNQIDKLTPKINPDMCLQSQISEPTTSKLVQANLDLGKAIIEEVNNLAGHVHIITGKDVNSIIPRSIDNPTFIVNEAIFNSNKRFDWILSKFRELNKELSNQFINQ